MAPDFRTYLASSIVSDGDTVTYRTLSRALKVHVNAAKCMLYEFHQKENTKSPGSVYATYLLSGRKKHNLLTVVPNKPQVNVDSSFINGDVPMPSSPPMGPPSSFLPASQETEKLEEPTEMKVKTITLCREELLESVKEQYEHITAIHIYSLSPSRLGDLQGLTDCNRTVFTDYHAKQDPLIHNKDYGIIQNPHARRRKGKRPVNFDAAQPKFEPVKDEKSASKPAPASAFGSKTTTAKPDLKREDSATSRPSSRDSTSTTQSLSKPNLKRDGSSLFKAFAKQSSKPKLERKNTDTSADSNIKMGGMDDNADEGESEDEAVFLDTNTRQSGTGSRKRPSDTQREREERQAKLRKMMDDDDEEPAVPKVSEATDMDAEPPAAKNGEDADAKEGDVEEDEDNDVAWSDSDTEGKKTKKEHKKAKEEEEAAPKRRRGRRKVMKKKTMKDEDGFLVTREEEGWESFSEDEPEPVRKAFAPVPKPAAQKTQSQTQNQKSSAAKGAAAAAAAAAAGGKKKDIMSFFGKR
ncbi:CDC27 protein [Neophaeococcomyces mojaviensis]|uniref:CDC27 protein n=1 Tax=Neophaeococcomyces mojaviensis TaxID=3383035 RepID=A0ACC3AIR9_9EURO|nr:CDC27 protein [Knufia sp. JES_112]